MDTLTNQGVEYNESKPMDGIYNLGAERFAHDRLRGKESHGYPVPRNLHANGHTDERAGARCG
jgi:hypothetical protein